MSDSEEDYMSDKFVAKCAKIDVRPGLQYRESDKRSFEMYKKKKEIVRKPSQKEQERRRLDEGLQTAISSDNKGFKMLEKMGYTSGSGIGKSSAGIKEPISISIKTNASGLGREQHIKDLQKTKIESKALQFQACENKFLTSKAEKLIAIYLKNDIHKGRRLCEELDMKQGIEYPQHSYLWQKHTIKDLDKKNKSKLKTANNVHGDDNDDSDDDDSDDDDQDSSSTDGEDDQDQAELLKNIIMYLRLTYNYCMYCGDFIEDGLECPGYFRIDHD